MPKHSHIIQKQTLEINFRGLDEAVGMQNRIAEVFYEKLKPSMQRVLDEEIGEKYSAGIERMEIDCGILTDKNWEEQWVETTLQKLREELRAINKKRITIAEQQPAPVKESLIPAESADQSFFFFLQNGYFPWNNRVHSIEEMEELIQTDEPFIIRLKELLRKYEQVAKRLVLRFSLPFTKKMMELLSKGKEKYFIKIVSLLEDYKLVIDKQQEDVALFSAFAIENEKEIVSSFFTFLYNKTEDSKQPVINKILEEIIAVEEGIPGKSKESSVNKVRKAVNESINEPGNESIKKPENEPETIYINNAGIILVHPFLQELFNRLLLRDKDGWTDKKASHSAAMILEFIATGKDKFPEFDMPLNKILCGIDPTEVLEAEIEIDYTIKETCNELLTVIIRHWSVLKNTSIDSLRETFLQRNGKLSRVDSGWLLQVEQKGVDILLGHLPWGTSTIKLPWMEEVLFTEWN